ncbi:hypothetical protein SNEBB_007076 [Seison nebaliae]|nr:hypothetical protein SNEBB_007076 [Seison nebaliae]
MVLKKSFDTEKALRSTYNGKFGKYQIRSWLIFTIPFGIFIGCFMRLQDFTLQLPSHHCVLREGNTTIKVPSNQYVINELKLIDSNSSIYNYSTNYGETVASEYDMFCEKRSLLNDAKITYISGMIIGSVMFGILGDNVGRKISLLTSCLSAASISLFQLVGDDFISFLFFQLLLGIFSGAVPFLGIIYIMEMFISDNRLHFVMLALIFSSVMTMILPWIAMILMNWRFLQIVCSFPIFLISFIYWFNDISIFWLLTGKNYRSAVEILKKQSTLNGVNLEEKFVEAKQFLRSCRNKQIQCDLDADYMEQMLLEPAPNESNLSPNNSKKTLSFKKKLKNRFKKSSENSEIQMGKGEKEVNTNVYEGEAIPPSTSATKLIRYYNKNLEDYEDDDDGPNEEIVYDSYNQQMEYEKDSQYNSMDELQNSCFIQFSKKLTKLYYSIVHGLSYQSTSSNHSFFHMFQSSIFMYTLFVLIMLWLSAALLSGSMDHYEMKLPIHHFYLHYHILYLLHFVSHLLVLLFTPFIGRKWSIFIFLIIGEVCLMASFIGDWNDDSSHQLALLCIYVFGKISAIASLDVMFIWTVELMPTSLRSSSMGICVAFSYLALLISSPKYIDISDWTARLIYAMFCLLFGALARTLPETRKCPLPKSIHQLEMRPTPISRQLKKRRMKLQQKEPNRKTHRPSFKNDNNYNSSNKILPQNRRQSNRIKHTKFQAPYHPEVRNFDPWYPDFQTLPNEFRPFDPQQLRMRQESIKSEDFIEDANSEGASEAPLRISTTKCVGTTSPNSNGGQWLYRTSSGVIYAPINAPTNFSHSSRHPSFTAVENTVKVLDKSESLKSTGTDETETNVNKSE